MTAYTMQTTPAPTSYSLASGSASGSSGLASNSLLQGLLQLSDASFVPNISCLLKPPYSMMPCYQNSYYLASKIDSLLQPDTAASTLTYTLSSATSNAIPNLTAQAPTLTSLPALGGGATSMMRPYGWIEIYGPIGVQIPPAIYSPVMSAINALPVASLIQPYSAPVSINNPLYDPNPVYINGVGSPINTTNTPLSPQNLQSSMAAPLINAGQQALWGIQSGDPFYQPALHDAVAQVPVANQYNPFTTSPPVMYFATPYAAANPVAQTSSVNPVMFNVYQTEYALDQTAMQPWSKLPAPAQEAFFQAANAAYPYDNAINSALQPYGLHTPSYPDAAWFAEGLGQHPLYEPALYSAVANSPAGSEVNPFTNQDPYYASTVTPSEPAILNSLIGQIAGAAPIPTFYSAMASPSATNQPSVPVVSLSPLI